MLRSKVQAALFSLLSSFWTTQAEAVTEVRVGYLPATHDSLLFIASDFRHFDATVIDVKLKPYENSVQILSDLKSGLIDIGSPGIATPAAEIGGRAALTIIGGAAAQSAALVAPPLLATELRGAPGAIAKFRLLRGKRIGAVRGSTGLAIFRQGLIAANMSASEVNVREYSKPPEITSAMLNGDLDAGLLWSPHMTLAQGRGFEIAVWMYEVLPNHVCCRQVARDEFLEIHPGATAAYLAGILKAHQTLRKAATSAVVKTRVRETLRKYLPTLSDEELELEIFSQNPRTSLSPDLDQEGVKSYLSAMSAAHLMQPDQCDHVAKKTSDRFLAMAYQRLGCSESEAKICAKGTLDACTCAR
jgi:NitT/TauT family transport system substrate-binding protein